MIKWRGRYYADPGLPPREFWLINPEKEKIPTPLDDRGIVDQAKLIKVVKATIDPAYKWAGPCDVHHFQWAKARYPVRQGRDVFSPRKFRELPVNKGVEPRVFHNWTHVATEEPPVPSEEVMRGYTEAWEVAERLFAHIRNVVQKERRMRRLAAQCIADGLPIGVDFDDAAAETLFDHFQEIDQHLEQLQAIPPEFQLVDPSQKPLELASALGRVVVPRQMTYTQAVAA